MVRVAIPLRYVAFLVMVIYNCLPDVVAFVPLSSTGRSEPTGHQQARIMYATIEGSSSLSSSLMNNNCESIAANDCGCHDHLPDPPPKKNDLPNRRNALFRVGTTALAVTLPFVVSPSSALALKQKNEALCGTGFFEHIYEYKCTAIGDIEDEGTSKSLSQAEYGVTDSLMGKLGFDTGDVIESIDSYDETKKKTDNKSKKGNTVAIKNDRSN